MLPDARAVMRDELRAVGFRGVTMLSGPVEVSDATELDPRVAA